MTCPRKTSLRRRSGPGDAIHPVPAAAGSRRCGRSSRRRCRAGDRRCRGDDRVTVRSGDVREDDVQSGAGRCCPPGRVLRVVHVGDDEQRIRPFQVGRQGRRRALVESPAARVRGRRRQGPVVGVAERLVGGQDDRSVQRSSRGHLAVVADGPAGLKGGRITDGGTGGTSTRDGQVGRLDVDGHGRWRCRPGRR